jgi:nicotinamidase-related amidase
MKEKNYQDTALLVMDVQVTITGMLKENTPQFLNLLKETIEAARRKNVQVIYVVVGFRKGYPEISDANKSFNILRNSGRNFDSEEGQRVEPKIAPQDNDIIIIKKRVSAFTGSDLEIVLHVNNIKHIVLTGISTSGVVLSTLREAADKDFRITVLADCCADTDAEVHQVLTTKVFPRQADVLNHQQWIDNLI